MSRFNEPSNPNASSLPANRAFVVQFGPATPDGAVPFEGRVEHLASGEVGYFSNKQELWKVFLRLLPHVECSSDNTQQSIKRWLQHQDP